VHSNDLFDISQILTVFYTGADSDTSAVFFTLPVNAWAEPLEQISSQRLQVRILSELFSKFKLKKLNPKAKLTLPSGC